MEDDQFGGTLFWENEVGVMGRNNRGTKRRSTFIPRYRDARTSCRIMYAAALLLCSGHILGTPHSAV